MFVCVCLVDEQSEVCERERERVVCVGLCGSSWPRGPRTPRTSLSVCFALGSNRRRRLFFRALGTRRLTPRSPISTLQQVLKPEKRYECLSYLPPLSDEEISRQIDYLVGNGWAPCIEFASQEEADTNQLFFAGPALYENRYWTMWKLPMFGCQSGDEVLAEIQNCQDEYPGYRVRVVGFDNVRQCQMAGFICRK